VSGPGLAREHDGSLVPDGDAPVAESAETDGSLRYFSAVPLPNGRTRSISRLPAQMDRTI
jgi:hypothetical protein